MFNYNNIPWLWEVQCSEHTFQGIGFYKHCPKTQNGNFCPVPCLKSFVGDVVKVQCVSGRWSNKEPICASNHKYSN